jgi:membrane protein implicated in regulation of membrane protease activity
VSQAVDHTANRPAGKSCTRRGYAGRRPRSRSDDDAVAIDHRVARLWNSGVVDAWVLWLIASGLFAAGEMTSGDLFLLMLAGGAVGGMSVALLGGPVLLQLVGFIVVSALLLVLVRPLAKRHLTEGTPEQLDGVAAVIGRTAKVTQAVDGRGGRIRLGADEWTVVGDAFELE